MQEGSTYKGGENGLPPIGLPHVIVGGHFVKRDGEATDALPGLPIRYPVEEESRWVPATTEQWLETFTIDDGSLTKK